MAVSAVLAALEGDWARAFQATIKLAAMKIAASRKTGCCLSVNIRLVPVIAAPSSRDQVYAQTDDPSNKRFVSNSTDSQNFVGLSAALHQ
jgi:hypothetical protein